MLIYHGTSLDNANKLLQKKFAQPGKQKASVWYTLNATNLLDEARLYAKRKKREDSREVWAIVEIAVDDKATIYKDMFTSTENKYRYDVYKQKKPDLIRISFANGFDLDLLYGFDKVLSCKIVEVV